MAVIDSFWTTRNGTKRIYGADGSGAQSITGDGNPLDNCAFLIARDGATGLPTGNAYAKLYAHSGTFGTSSVPTGSPLAISDPFDVSTLPAVGVYGLRNFKFSIPYTLGDGTNYCIAIEYTGGDNANAITVGYYSLGGHAGNYSDLGGGSWGAEVYDVIFYCYTGAGVQPGAIGTPVTGTGTTITPTIPTGTADGDLMVAFVPCRATATPGTETGWDSAALTLSSINMRMYYRFKQAGDGNPTFDISNAGAETVSAFIISFYNVHATTPLDVAITDAGDFSAPGSPYNVTLTGFDTATDGAFAVYGWVSLDDNTWVYQSGGGAGLVATNATDATDISVCVAGESIPTAGGTGDQVAQQTTKQADAGALFYFALKPVEEDTGITGTISGTCAQVTGAVAGAVKVAGAVAANAAQVTGAIAGAVAITGEIAAGCSPAVAAVEGSHFVAPIEGTVAATAASVTAALAGAVQITGTVEAGATQATAAATGANLDSGSINASIASATSAISGTVLVTGAISATCVPVTASVEGVHAPATGSVDANVTAVTGAVTGAVLVSGSIDAGVAVTTAAVAGAALIAGSVGASAAAVTADIAGAVAITGAIEANLAQVTASVDSGAIVSGSIDANAGAVTAAVSSTALVAASIDANLSQVTGAVTGAVAIAGDIDATAAAVTGAVIGGAADIIHGSIATNVSPVTGAIAGAVLISGGVAATIVPTTAAVTSQAFISAAVAANMAQILAAIEGNVAISGSIAAILAAASASVEGTVGVVTTRGRFRRIPGRGVISCGGVFIPGEGPVDSPDMEKN